MKLAIISDIHANLEALTSCLKKINELGADKIFCLGDLIDYCANPNECVALIKQYCDIVILGNHEEAQFEYKLADGFSNDAKISSIHTRSIIDPKYIDYFKSLPYKYFFTPDISENLLFVHSSPDNPKQYSYILNENTADFNFKCFKEDICFIGHSHIPVIFMKTKKGVKSVTEKDVIKGYRYIINVGSVGQPRDGNPCSSFGFFDSDSWVYKNIRVEYDVQIASSKIKNEGLPQYLGAMYTTKIVYKK